MDNKEVTYAQVFDFYYERREITQNPKTEQIEQLELLGRYITSLGQQESPYIQVFNAIKGEKPAGKDDIIFAEIVEKYKFPQEKGGVRFYSLDKFKDYYDEVIHPSDKYNQAWHLLVAYMAYQEVDAVYHFSKKKEKNKDDEMTPFHFEMTPFNLYNSCKCVELMLWMAIAAEVDSGSIIKAFENVFADNTGNCGTICSKIRGVIPWETISNIIMEECKPQYIEENK